MTNLSSIHEAPSHPTGYGKLSTQPSVPAASRRSNSQTAAASLSIPTVSISSSSSVSCSGYLHKRSSILKSWRLNFWVLTGQTLTAFTSKAQYDKLGAAGGATAAVAAAVSAGQKQVGVGRVAARSLSPSQHTRPFCFTLQDAESDREHLFAAATERERSVWVDAITRVVRQPGDAFAQAQGTAGTGQDKRGVRMAVEVMSGRRINSNALLSSSSSSSNLASITHTVSASSASSSQSSSNPEHCHSCHAPFSVVQRHVPCHRCSRVFCETCAPHTVVIREAGAASDGDGEERRMCNRCHETLLAAAQDTEAGDQSERPDSRRTTKTNAPSDDSIDEVPTAAVERIFISVPTTTADPAAAAPALPSAPPAASAPAVHSSTLMSQLSTEPVLMITSERVEATKELVSPAPTPGSPPPSPLSALPPATRPASPALTSPSSAAGPPPSFSAQLTLRIPENREQPIVVLSREEIDRIERERRRKGLPDGGRRLGSVVIGAAAQPVKQPAAHDPNDNEHLVRRPWYACGC